MEQKPFEQMSITELKALAYDQLAIIERSQQNMQRINARIAELSQQEAEQPEPLEE